MKGEACLKKRTLTRLSLLSGNAIFTTPIMETNILIGGIIMKNYQVIFYVKGLENSTFVGIEELKDVMGSELIRVYNIYADRTNEGITEKLNDGYQRLIVDDLNKQNISPILNFYVDSTEVVFTGYLKLDKKVTISFSLQTLTLF